jgi:hypothetical protein
MWWLIVSGSDCLTTLLTRFSPKIASSCRIYVCQWDDLESQHACFLDFVIHLLLVIDQKFWAKLERLIRLHLLENSWDDSSSFPT